MNDLLLNLGAYIMSNFELVRIVFGQLFEICAAFFVICFVILNAVTSIFAPFDRMYKAFIRGEKRVKQIFYVILFLPTWILKGLKEIISLIIA